MLLTQSAPTMLNNSPAPDRVNALDYEERQRFRVFVRHAPKSNDHWWIAALDKIPQFVTGSPLLVIEKEIPGHKVMVGPIKFGGLNMAAHRVKRKLRRVRVNRQWAK